jgi:hypothetical protein
MKCEFYALVAFFALLFSYANGQAYETVEIFSRSDCGDSSSNGARLLVATTDGGCQKIPFAVN